MHKMSFVSQQVTVSPRVVKRSIGWHLVCDVKHAETRASLLSHDDKGASQAEARTFLCNISFKCVIRCWSVSSGKH